MASEKCRLCGRSIIIAEEIVDCLQNNELQLQIFQLFDIKITAEDVHPKVICRRCDTKLQDFAEFQTLVWDTQLGWHTKHMNQHQQRAAAALLATESDAEFRLYVSDSSICSSTNNSDVDRSSSSSSDDDDDDNTPLSCKCRRSQCDSGPEQRFHRTAHAAGRCPVCASLTLSASCVATHWDECGAGFRRQEGGDDAVAAVAASKKKQKQMKKTKVPKKAPKECTVRLVDCRKRKRSTGSTVVEAAAGVKAKKAASSVTANASAVKKPHTESVRPRVTRSSDAPLASPLHFVDMSDASRSSAALIVQPARILARRNTRLASRHEAVAVQKSAPSQAELQKASQVAAVRTPVEASAGSEASAAAVVRPARILARRNTSLASRREAIAGQISASSQAEVQNDSPVAAARTPVEASAASAAAVVRPARILARRTTSLASRREAIAGQISAPSQAEVQNASASEASAAAVVRPARILARRNTSLASRREAIAGQISAPSQAEVQNDSASEASAAAVVRPARILARRNTSLASRREAIAGQISALSQAQVQNDSPVAAVKTPVEASAGSAGSAASAASAAAVVRPARILARRNTSLSSRREAIAVQIYEPSQGPVQNASQVAAVRTPVEASAGSAASAAAVVQPARISGRRAEVSPESVPREATVVRRDATAVASAKTSTPSAAFVMQVAAEAPTEDNAAQTGVASVASLTVDSQAATAGKTSSVVKGSQTLAVSGASAAPVVQPPPILVRRVSQLPWPADAVVQIPAHYTPAAMITTTAQIATASMKTSTTSSSGSFCIPFELCNISRFNAATFVVQTTHDEARAKQSADSLPFGEPLKDATNSVRKEQPSGCLQAKINRMLGWRNFVHKARDAAPGAGRPAALAKRRQTIANGDAQRNVDSGAQQGTTTTTTADSGNVVMKVERLATSKIARETVAMRRITLPVKTMAALRKANNEQAKKVLVDGGASKAAANGTMGSGNSPTSPISLSSNRSFQSLKILSPFELNNRVVAAAPPPPPPRPLPSSDVVARACCVRPCNSRPQHMSNGVCGLASNSRRPLSHGTTDQRTASAAELPNKGQRLRIVTRQQTFCIRLKPSERSPGQMTIQVSDADGRPIDIDRASDQTLARMRNALRVNSQFEQVLRAVHMGPMDADAMRLLGRLLTPKRMSQLRRVRETQ